jgi:hypothetical protein
MQGTDWREPTLADEELDGPLSTDDRGENE